MLGAAGDDAARVRHLIDGRQLARAEDLVVRHMAAEGRAAEWILLLAEIRLDQRRFRESLELLDGARRLGDFSARNRLLAGLNYVASNRLDLAEPELRAALAADEKNAPAFYYLGRLLYTRNLFQEAIEKTKRAISLAPDLIRAYDNLGLCYEGLHRESDAERAYLEGIRRQELTGARVEWPALNLGTLLLKRGDHKRARSYLEQALAVNPDSAEAHFRLGSVLEHEHDREGALAQYRKAVALDSKLAAAYYRSGLIYRAMGMKQEAEEQFTAFRRSSSGK